MDALSQSNEALRIKIDDHGAELSEIYDKEKDRQVLWNADPAHWKRHAPVLFPNVGRYYQDQCLIGGQTYSCGQHGFARDMEFTCTEETPDSVAHLLTSTEETQRSILSALSFILPTAFREERSWSPGR